MQISITDLRKGPREIDIDLAPEQLRLIAERFTFPERVGGRVRFQLVGSRALAQGYLEMPLETACGRCLAPIRRTVQVDVTLVWEKRPDTGDDHEAALAAAWEAENQEFDYYDEDLLDPTDQFRQLLLMQLPDYPLCREDCRGLCPCCGIDLNVAACTCETQTDKAVGETEWKARLRQIRLN
jgi:uncharacterized protein